MVKGAESALWGKVGTLAAMIAEPNRNQKKRRKPFTASDFTPDWLSED